MAIGFVTEDEIGLLDKAGDVDQSECTHSKNCSLFNLLRLESNNQIWRSVYCQGKFTECARYQAAQRGKPIPLTLLPNGKWLGT